MHELADRSRRIAAPTDSRERRHSRVVPPLDVAFVDEPLQLALARDGEHEIAARELDLPRAARPLPELIEEPVVERPVILELERAERMRRAFDRVRKRVRVVVHRIDAPLVARALVRHLANPIERRIAQVDVRRGHVDLRPQHAFAFRELTAPHGLEQPAVLLGRAVAVGAVASRLGQGTAILADLLRRGVIDVGESAIDELERELVKLREIIRGVTQPIAPVEAEPANVRLDGLDVFLALFLRIRVVEA
jgi:hypothetical protein